MTGAGTHKQEISVYPNPVVNGIINLQLNNQPTGNYNIRLLNKSGQVLMKTQIEHAEVNATEIIPINKDIPHGIYQLVITIPGNNQVHLDLVD